jgi:pimeloyl-ACP methyl ester carboxylesterase
MSTLADRPAVRAATLTALAVLLAGCGKFLPAPVPMRTLVLTPAPAGNHALIVFLPGRGGTPEEFATAGFDRRLAEHGIAAEVVSPAASLGYYLRRTIDERLRADVIAPARARGVTHVWLVGISLGGLGALVYADRHPGEVDAVLALAPYLGDNEVIDEIKAAGGLARWRPAAPVAKDDFQRRLWLFLKRYAAGEQNLPLLCLGYGASDRFAAAHALLAAVLPPERVFTVPGHHDWPTWRALWQKFLATDLLARSLR